MPLTVQLKWTEGYQFVARADEGPGILIDSTDGGSGPTPMELLLMGVAGCTGIDVVLILRKKRLDLRDFRINITGEQAEEEPKRFTKIHLEYLIHGTGIKPKAVEQAISLRGEILQRDGLVERGIQPHVPDHRSGGDGVAAGDTFS